MGTVLSSTIYGIALMAQTYIGNNFIQDCNVGCIVLHFQWYTQHRGVGAEDNSCVTHSTVPAGLPCGPAGHVVLLVGKCSQPAFPDGQIVMSLLRTIGQLQLRKQIIKLNMYKRFLMTLIITGIVSSLMIVAEAYAPSRIISPCSIVTVSTDPDNTWQSNWIWNAFWLLFYLAILLAIAILWRPVSNNTRYAYSELGNESDIENNDGEITLQSFNLITQRRTPSEDQNNNVLYQPQSVKLDEHKEARVVEMYVVCAHC